ncbi:MAG: glycosyltransferase family 1 protein [Ignavibacteriales bacterium]|nr:glycosyltransferase family 1 protein [Ignavibacteriales bacterium]
MIIGFDAKWFFDGHPSGKRITQNIVAAFAELNLIHEVVIFLDKKYQRCSIRNPKPNIRYVYIWAGNNLLSNLFILPFHAKKERIDVLFSNNFSPISGRYMRVTWILDVIFKSHPNYFTLKERFYFSFIKPLALAADHLCTISFSEKKRMLKYGFSSTSDNIDVIYLGIENKFKSKENHDRAYLEFVKKEYGLPERFLLYVGRLNQRKNLDSLLKAYAFLENSPELIPLVLAGSPDWKMFDINKILEELNIKNKVILTGFVDDEYLPAIYALATVFCYVSYEEGFGLPPLESMASGIPVIASNSSSLPEICGDAAIYVDPHDVKDIARGIKEYLTNQNLCDEMKKRGLFQASKYKWEYSALKIIELANSIFKKKLH